MRVNLFSQANAVLTREGKADRVLAFNRHWPGIVDFASVVAGCDSRLVLGQQAPGLAAEEFPAIAELGLAPCLPETEGIAVALVVVRSGAGRQKVTRYVAGEFHIFQFAADKDSRSRLAGGAEELRQTALRSAGHGEVVEGSDDVRSQFARAAHKFGGCEASRRDGDALEMDGHGGLPLRANILHFLRGRFGALHDILLNRNAGVGFRQLLRNGLSWGCVSLGCSRRGGLLQLPSLLALQLLCKPLDL